MNKLPDFEEWNFRELAANKESVDSLMEGTFDRSVDAIKEVEDSVLLMMSIAKEHTKAVKNYGNAMKTAIVIEMNGVDRPALVKFHYSENEQALTDVFKVELISWWGINPDITQIYNEDMKLQRTISEDVEANYKEGNYE